MSNKSRKTQTKATRQAKHYIFRWKDDGICVTPSRSNSVDECWDFALEWLRPAQGKLDIRKLGEVIEDNE